MRFHFNFNTCFRSVLLLITGHHLSLSFQPSIPPPQSIWSQWHGTPWLINRRIFASNVSVWMPGWLCSEWMWLRVVQAKRRSHGPPPRSGNSFAHLRTNFCHTKNSCAHTNKNFTFFSTPWFLSWFCALRLSLEVVAKSWTEEENYNDEGTIPLQGRMNKVLHFRGPNLNRRTVQLGLRFRFG